MYIKVSLAAIRLADWPSRHRTVVWALTVIQTVKEWDTACSTVQVLINLLCLPCISTEAFTYKRLRVHLVCLASCGRLNIAADRWRSSKGRRSNNKSRRQKRYSNFNRYSLRLVLTLVYSYTPVQSRLCSVTGALSYASEIIGASLNQRGCSRVSMPT